MALLTEAEQQRQTLLDESEALDRALKEKHDAHVYQVDKWADSCRLAYEINGLKRGTYMVVWFRCKPAAIAEIDCATP